MVRIERGGQHLTKGRALLGRALFSGALLWSAALSALGLFSNGSLYADIARAYASSLNVDDTGSRIEALMGRIDGDNFYAPEETEGYKYRFYSRWLSAYSYDIFIGTISAKNSRTIIRLEGNEGEILTLAQIMEKEGIIQAGSTRVGDGELRLPAPKYHLIAQGLNLLSPSIGIWYQASNSPLLTGGQAVYRAVAFLMADLVALYIGGSRFFQTRFRSEENSRYIVALLGINRFTGALYTLSIIRGHNNLVELGYTLRFN